MKLNKYMGAKHYITYIVICESKLNYATYQHNDFPHEKKI